MRWLSRQWFLAQPSVIGLLFSPLAALYWLGSAMHRWSYRFGLRNVYQPPVPVIIIGNMIAGGAGKTPIVMALVQAFLQRRIQVAVISRGYGISIQPNDPPVVVTPEALADPAKDFPDEPALIAHQTGVTVYCHPQRRRAVECAVGEGAQLIIADDGLQHYALGASIRVVIHPPHLHRFGNGWLLPVGPLRQLPNQMKADYQLQDQQFLTDKVMTKVGEIIGYHYRAVEWVSVIDPAERRPLNHFADQSAVAFAGIAYPARFRQQLHALSVQLNTFVGYPDHHQLTAEQLSYWLGSPMPVLMTSKDAMKFTAAIERYYPERQPDSLQYWMLTMQADLPTDFVSALLRDVGWLPANGD